MGVSANSTPIREDASVADLRVEQVDTAPHGLTVSEFRAVGTSEVSMMAVVRPPHREAWVGLFWTVHYGLPTVTSIDTWEGGSLFLAVGGGEPYLIDATDPDRYTQPLPGPVLHRIRLPDLVVLGNFTSLAVLNRSGLLWERGIADDGLQSLSVEGATIRGERWDAPKGDWFPFRVSLESGDSMAI